MSESKQALVLNRQDGVVTFAKCFPGNESPIGIWQANRWVWLTAEEIQRLHEWVQAQQEGGEGDAVSLGGRL